MKVFKNSFCLPALLACAVIYGCGGGGGGTTSTGIIPPPPPPPASCTFITLTSSSRLKISVKDNGIYVITPNTLKQFCLDPSAISLSSFKLQNFDPATKTMVDIPVSYDSQGNMEFYGVGVNRNDYTSLNADYTETNIYWLIPSFSSNLMFSKTSTSGGTLIPAMTTFHQEVNQIYWPGMINGAGIDHWFWDQLVPRTTPIYQFTINNYDSYDYQSSPAPISLSLALESQIATTHSLSVLAPAYIGSVSWNTTTPYVFTSSYTGHLTNGPNILQFTNIPSGDKVYFNWLELEYPGQAYNDQIMFHGNFSLTGSYSFSINGFTQNTIELFDVSNPKAPLVISNSSVVPLTGGGYQLAFSDTISVPNNYVALTPAQRKTPTNITRVNSVDLKTLTGGFDYLIIAHGSFFSNVQRLVTYRNSLAGGRHSVQVVTMDDVYDSFSGGIFTPQAIKDFLNRVYPLMAHPSYVLLVGDASFDYKNYLSYGQENFVPTYLMEYSFGQTPSDYWFIQNSVGNLPLMAIGRIPAKTGTEVDTIISKIIGYEQNPPPANSWNKNAIFIAADDPGATFETDSNTLSSVFPANINNRIPIYYSILGSNTYSSIISYINTGALITNYLGHGSVEMWANGINGNLGNIFFQSSDVSNLVNIKNLTFLVTLNCLNGMFAGPGEGLLIPNSQPPQYNSVSLAETFLKSNKGGAVGAFSPTGQGFSTYHVPLAQQLYQTIFATGNPQPILGLAIQQMEKAVLQSNVVNLETVSIFVLLGDPATRLALP